MKLVGICGAIGSGKSTFAELITSVAPEHSLHLETSGLIVELANTFNDRLYEHIGELNPDNDSIPLMNALVTALIPQLSAMAGHPLTLAQLAIDPRDVAMHPAWYEKLFLYLGQARQLPAMLTQEVNSTNKNNYRPLLQWIGGYFLYKLDNQLLWYEELLRRAMAAESSIELVALTAPRQPSEAEFVQKAGGKVIKIVRPGLESDNSDVTERLVAAIIPDSVVTNNGSLKDLQNIASKLREDMLADHLQTVYAAH